MKKALKIIISIFLAIGVIALVVCYIVIPTQTQMAMDKVIEYLNTPFGICGVSITIGGVFLFLITEYIMSNTSFGKGKLNELQDKVVAYNQASKQISEENKNKVDNVVNTFNEKTNELKKGLDKVENALSLVPNKKVQEALKNGEEETKDN